MHTLAAILTALAGLAYLAASLRRWRRLASGGTGGAGLIIAGVVLHGCAVFASLAEGEHRVFACILLGLWAGVAGLLFAIRALRAPGALLLAFPAGALALLFAVAGFLRPFIGAADAPELRAIGVAHVILISAAMAAALLSGAAGTLYLVAVAQLKRGAAGVLAMPALPRLERLGEGSLVVSAALMIAALALGAVAIPASHKFNLAHPTALLGIVALILAVSGLVLRASGRLGRRGLSLAEIACAVLAALATASALMVAHGG